MSLKLNIISNYVSQLYVTAAGIAMVPLYIKYMGAESYGLVGFFSMLQAFFNLLDMGLTPTMAREAARYNGGVLSEIEYRRLTRALEGIFFTIALVGGVLLFALSDSIATRWLNASEIPAKDVATSLKLMAAIIALRWMCGLYRGVITGTERLVWLSSFNAFVATARFFLVLPLLIFYSVTPIAFFGFQLVVALLEISGLAWMTYQLLPQVPSGQHIHWQWEPLKPVLKFSLSIAFTSSVWALVTQTDKLVLSKILPLSDYGYFTIAVLVASAIAITSGPISSAIMPRLSRLQAEGNQEQLISIYRQATQLVAIISVPVALVLVMFSKQVLWAWTGNSVLVEKAAPVLSLYAAGYGVLAIAAFPFYLQYAKGDLKLHLIGNAITLFTLIPSVIWTAVQYGLIGPGWAWLISHTIYLTFWIPVVHQRFLPGLHWSWLGRDVLLPMLLPIACSFVIDRLVEWADNRLILSAQLFSISFLLILLGLPMADKIKWPDRIKCKPTIS